ncbi:glycerophosphodiester phosphodiesterase [Paenibacillus polysaccharolyticus]|uniref:glycerophosphodiester phosphodiesterase n=1 Tax=Paenibacillus polysaccharolyticus TaxID=582692 RepID=UPI0020A03685|nr:glycerophosphodiester phosphodiesterase family protein [Paenibacillus polysaccharolyticus]MCP1136201.1 glycerophosphodiester phosphodiesterase [Paenibacillus polysaccharolyticus]
MRELFVSKGFPLVGAHRGASQYYPENTMLAYQKAYDMGADYIELDVHLSKDEVPVIMHDATLERTSNGTGKLRDYTVDQLKQLDVGRWFSEEYAGERIPTLEEVLLWANGKVGVNIELKQMGVNYELLERNVLETIKKTRMMDQVQAMSFNHKSVKKIKDMDERIFTGIILFGELYDPIAVAKQVRCDFFNTTWMFHSQDAIKELHQSGYLVCGGHNDIPEKWVEMQSWGIDMFETNTPDVMQKLTVRRPDLRA